MPGIGGGRNEAKQRAETTVSVEMSDDSAKYTHDQRNAYRSCTNAYL